MKRLAFLLAFLSMLIVPASASAWFFRCWHVPYYRSYGYGYGGYGYRDYGYGGGYGGNWYAFPLQPYAVPAYPLYPAVYPAYPAPLASPAVQPANPASPGTNPRTEVPVAPSRAPNVTVIPGRTEPKPVPGTAGSSGSAAPSAAPDSRIPDPTVPLKRAGSSDAKPLPTDPSTGSPVVPSPKGTKPLPPLQIPDLKPMKPNPSAAGEVELPPLKVPGTPPNAKPIKKAIEPAGGTVELPPIQLPVSQPQAKPGKSATEPDDLPPLVLPPETPGGPSGVVPSVGPTTSRSSPLTGALKVQVFEAGGPVPASSLRKIGFFNHTTRDIQLVIEGKTVTLPKKSYLQAKLPVKFTWKHSGGQSKTATVPANASGLDVLFRE